MDGCDAGDKALNMHTRGWCVVGTMNGPPIVRAHVQSSPMTEPGALFQREADISHNALLALRT